MEAGEMISVQQHGSLGRDKLVLLHLLERWVPAQIINKKPQNEATSVRSPSLLTAAAFIRLTSSRACLYWPISHL
jgi:hypothetical protein